jgi:flagellar assembly factor FliW
MVFQVKSPILGFGNLEKVEYTKVDEFFSSLKNADGATPAFTLVNPYSLREYSFDVPASAKVLLDLKDNSKVEVYCIVVLQNPIEKSAVNFLAPLIFNLDNNTMAQVVLDGSQHSSYGVAEEMELYIKKD